MFGCSLYPFALAAALPGLAQGALFAQMLTRGSEASFPFVMGMVTDDAVWLIAAMLGLSALAAQFATVFVAVKWLGVAYLLLIAWKLWTAGNAPEQTSPPDSGNLGLLAGVLLTLGNPKAVVFFGAVLPHAFDLTHLSVAEASLIFGLGLSIDLTIQGAYLLTAGKARVFMRSPRSMRLVNRSSAGLLAGSATLIATR